MAVGDIGKLPILTREVMESWVLGGDGKGYFHGVLTDEYYIRLMRK